MQAKTERIMHLNHDVTSKWILIIITCHSMKSDSRTSPEVRISSSGSPSSIACDTRVSSMSSALIFLLWTAFTKCDAARLISSRPIEKWLQWLNCLDIWTCSPYVTRKHTGYNPARRDYFLKNLEKIVKINFKAGRLHLYLDNILILGGKKNIKFKYFTYITIKYSQPNAGVRTRTHVWLHGNTQHNQILFYPCFYTKNPYFLLIIQFFIYFII